MRVAVLGAGRIGAFHAHTLIEHDAVDDLVVADADLPRAQDVAGQLGARPVGSPDEALETGPDAVVIATPTSTHADLIAAAVHAGIPAFCEKPVALTLEGNRRVVDLVERHGALVQIGFQRRFDVAYMRARTLVADGSLGRVYAVRMTGHDPAPPPANYIATSGGIFADSGIHDFDIVRWVTGQAVVEVFATGAVLGFPEFAKHDDVDTAVTVLTLSGGTLAVLTSVRHNPAGYDVRMELIGSRDSVAVGVTGRTPLRSLEPDGPPAPQDPYPGFIDRFRPAYRAQLDCFLSAVRGDADNPCTAADALEALRVAEAARRSLAQGRPVALEPVG